MCTCCEDCKEAYLAMVEKVRAVDAEAADFLLGSEVEEIPHMHFDGDLSCCFVFSKSPQGHTYWYGIYNAISGESNTL